MQKIEAWNEQSSMCVTSAPATPSNIGMLSLRILYARLEIAATARAVARNLLVGTEQIPLRDVYDRLEAAVPQLVESAVVAELRYVAASKRIVFFAGAGSSFVYDSVLHESNVTPHATQLSTLAVALLEGNANVPAVTNERPTASITGLGRYETVELQTSEGLAPLHKQILAAACDALGSFYSEMMEWTFRRFSTLRTDAAIALYDAVRRAVSEPHAENVWLWAFALDQNSYTGSYIVDQRAREVVFDRATSRRDRTKRSPAALATDFLTHILPLEKSFTWRSIATGKPAAGEFATAPYLDEGMNTAEQAVYQSAGLIVQPVASSDASILVAAYPADLGSHVMRPLESAATELRRLLCATEEALHSHRRDVETIVKGKPESLASSLWSSLELKVPLPMMELDIKKLFSKIAAKKRRGGGDGTA